MASPTEISNLALSHLGIDKEIANLDTENSVEARACRRFYELARNATLRDHAWPFASKISELGLVEEDPNDEWGYSYRYPSDCLNFRRILSGMRNDSAQSRVPYKIIQDSSGLLILTDQSNADCEYTIIATDTLRYPPDFVNALSLRLAAYAAPKITAGTNLKLGDRAMQMYVFEISVAKSNGVNEEQSDQVPESEFIRARE